MGLLGLGSAPQPVPDAHSTHGSQAGLVAQYSVQPSGAVSSRLCTGRLLVMSKGDAKPSVGHI